MIKIEGDVIKIDVKEFTDYTFKNIKFDPTNKYIKHELHVTFDTHNGLIKDLEFVKVPTNYNFSEQEIEEEINKIASDKIRSERNLDEWFKSKCINYFNGQIPNLKTIKNRISKIKRKIEKYEQIPKDRLFYARSLEDLNRALQTEIYSLEKNKKIIAYCEIIKEIATKKFNQLRHGDDLDNA